MPKTIVNQNTGDNYTEQGGANINSVYESRGGWVTLPAEVLAEIQHSPESAQQGSEAWSEEFLLPSGAHSLEPGTVGIRFKSATPGNPVLVNAAIFYKWEPSMSLGGSGISSPFVSVGALNFQHNAIAVATEPTIDFEDGVGLLKWLVVDDPANTRVKVTPDTSLIAPLASPAFTGVPTAPTPATGDNSTTLATTAYVKNQGYATLVSPAFTGNPTAPTQATADNSTRLATTAYVQNQGYLTAASGVSSFNTRVGAVTSQTGDYTAAQVTNAFDLSNAGTQTASGTLVFGTNFSLPQNTTGLQLNTGGGVSHIVATATTNAIVVGVANNTDTVGRFVARPDRLEWGPGNTNRDTFETRVLNTTVLGNTSGTESGLEVTATTGGFLLAQGSIISGAVDQGTIANGGSLSPDFAQGNEWSGTMSTTGSTTMTIANPVNRPVNGGAGAAGFTAFLIIRLRNNAASGGTTITWGTAYASTLGVALPTTINFGQSKVVVFFWDSLSGVWYPIISA